MASNGETRRGRLMVLAALLVMAGTAGGGWWWLRRDHVVTEDAFVDGDVVHIAPQVGGTVAAVRFTDNQTLAPGEVMVEIDPRDYEAALAAAIANLHAAETQRQAAQAALDLVRVTSDATVAEARSALDQARQNVAQARAAAEAAQADAVRAGADSTRAKELFRTAAGSGQRLDQATADARGSQARWHGAQAAVSAAEAQVAQAQARLTDALSAPQQVAVRVAQLATAGAQVEQAQAAVRTAELNLSYTTIRVPQAGRATRKAVAVGDVVQKNQVLTDLVTTSPWVVANFKETQLTRVRPGQPVEMTIDAWPDLRLTGRVDSIQAGTGARFSLLPAENATGNWIKVVQRVPVKIVFDHPAELAARLSLGMSVVPDIDVGAAP